MEAVISLIIPVYQNEENIPALLKVLDQLNEHFEGDFETVLVVDGSADRSLLLLGQALPRMGFRSQLLSLSRNFGSFSAIRAGLSVARGEHLAVMAADLQEPPELIMEFHEKLASGDYDVAIGERMARNDPASSTLASRAFWGFYRRFVQPELPAGGVDVFACTRAVSAQLLRLEESNTSLVGLLFWVGFRRVTVPYERRAREAGISAWTFSRKMRYLADSIFAFSDLPIRTLLYVGLFGLATSTVLAAVVAVCRLAGLVQVPGYTATVLIVTFFGALNCFGLGLIGGYVWRAFENTKVRPNFIVARHDTFEPGREPA